ncbi:hypothetical protein N7508_007455 [Penicillium antarcticum]|uniref:uncharacterized protein n=1 Tax=Penicillium antarcticum TaxID=416450 RepID=UPI00238D3FD7|nr:uncharacterized protein N7508_007455 [Penicillium antarcticum]KAJ5300212.1 hypothetical protein N7508_007455 [Penicillium antarcticum]
MAPWQVPPPLLLSLVFRLVLEKRVALALAENLLLIGLIQRAELSWTTILVIVTVFVASAFFQTQSEYAGSVQSTDSGTAPRGCPVKIWDSSSGCRTDTLRQWNQKSNYGPLRKAQVPESDGDLHAGKAFHGRVTMFPCDLRHLRRSGFKNDYHHSYLYVGYPVGLRACYSPLVTVEPPFRPRFLLPTKKAWFRIRPEDHAFNGGANLSMTQKLEEFLLSEGEDPAEWPYAYLLTPPSVTWQLNNPLSFWYLRRMASVGCGSRGTAERLRPGMALIAFKANLRRIYKSHHLHPLRQAMLFIRLILVATPLEKLKIMVTLKEGNETVMHGVVNSTGLPLDAATATVGSSIRFLVSWWWVPMCSVVVFRILFKAAKIYLTHNRKELNIQTRAENTKTAISKSARLSER